MHTILGSGGNIANELVKELIKNNEQFRLVSRNPKPQGNGELRPADITNVNSVNEAVKGSDVVYLLAGLQYNIKVWRVQWPKIMNNVIEACKRYKAKLIFFDNVYCYGLVNGPMTEDSPYNPISKKGEIRARIATQLMDEVKRGNLRASIARAADFYGPKAERTVPNVMIFDNLSKSKKPQLLVRADTYHSYTFIPDAGKAVYLLSKNDLSFDQVWHMPTASPPLTGREFVTQAAKAFNAEPKYTLLSKFMIRIAGMFNRDIREIYEMLYQNEYDYGFDSSKFEKVFSFHPTSYEEGIGLVAQSYRQK